MNFFKNVFSDGGAPSFSRIATGVLVASVVVWVSIIVWRTTALPSDLIALAGFMGSLYAVNVAGGTVRAFKSGSGTDKQ